MNWLKSLSFKTKLLLTVAISCAICGVVSLSVAVHYNKNEFYEGLVKKSQTIHGRLDVAAAYVANQGGLKPMIKLYTQKYKDSSQLTDDDKAIILQQVPIYAAMKIGAQGAEKEGYKFRVFSNEARNKNNIATADEMKIFNQFESDPNLNELITKNEQQVIVYRPVRLKEEHGCLNCHGHPSTSPWGNGRDILGYQMEDWKNGKLHGVFAISSDVEAVLKAQSDAGGISSTTSLAFFITLGAIAALIFTTFVIKGPLKNLKTITTSLSKTGDDVKLSIMNMTSSSQSLSEASAEQAASLEQTAASLEEISSMVNKNTENAKRTAETSDFSKNKANEGKESVERMIQSMEEINESNRAIMTQVNQSNQEMSEIVKVIQEIGNKTKVINDIVFQTKLLSFNASVEAARAGEHGKGFAVVAEEVGKLAQMSGNAAKEISEMLSDSTSKVDRIVMNTKTQVEVLITQGHKKVESGISVSRQCSDLLNEIVTQVANVSNMASEISGASQEQSQGISEINKAMNQLDQVTQQNAATSEETANTAAKLSAQSETLHLAVEELMRTIDGYTDSNLPPETVEKEITQQTPNTSSSKKNSGSKSHSLNPKNNIKPFKKVVGEGLSAVPSSHDSGFEDSDAA